MADTRIVRRATLRDVPTMYALMNKLNAYVGYVPKGGLIDRVETGRIVVAECNGHVAGYVSYTHRRDGLTHLGQVAVHPDLWRTKHGSDLWQWLEGSALMAGSEAITLKVAADIPAVRFWDALGLVAVGFEQPKRRRLIVYAHSLRALDARNTGRVVTPRHVIKAKSHPRWHNAS